jgi:hypothetical protein
MTALQGCCFPPLCLMIATGPPLRSAICLVRLNRRRRRCARSSAASSSACLEMAWRCSSLRNSQGWTHAGGVKPFQFPGAFVARHVRFQQRAADACPDGRCPAACRRNPRRCIAARQEETPVAGTLVHGRVPGPHTRRPEPSSPFARMGSRTACPRQRSAFCHARRRNSCCAASDASQSELTLGMAARARGSTRRRPLGDLRRSTSPPR